MSTNLDAVSSPDVDEEVAAMLTAVGQRYTSGRRRLIAALQKGDGPLTTHEIAAVDTTLAQSSIYRNLTLLEDAGAVTRIVTNDDFARYELAEGLTEHHHHLICTQCGAVLDFELDHGTESTLDKALHRAAESAGFITTSHRLDLLGICSSCGAENG